MSDFRKDSKYQAIRNKVYALVGVGISVAVIFGVVDASAQEGVAAGFDSLVEHGEAIAGIVIAVMGWMKSRPSKVTVVSVPDVRNVLGEPEDF